MKDRISIKPIFVENENVRNFRSMMAGLDMSAGEGRFGLMWGRAGRGKTRTAQWWTANNPDCIYILMLKLWRTSPTEFLLKLASELQIKSPPRRTGPLFNEVAERLERGRPTVFIDEPDKLPPAYLEILRDLTQFTAAPFILIGEEKLPGMMRTERRVWSRTFGQVEFKPFSVKDVVQYVGHAAEIRFTTSSAAEAVCKESEGDIRLVKVIFYHLVQILNSKNTAEADLDTVNAAIRQAGLDAGGKREGR